MSSLIHFLKMAMTLKRAYSCNNRPSAKRAKTSYTRQNFTTKKLVPSRYAVPPKKVELKYDDGGTTTAGSLTGNITLLSTIGNGTGPSERIGRHVAYSDLTMNWHFNVTANTDNAYVRFVLIYDRQTNAATPGVTEVMNGTDVNALFNPDNRSRFSPLFDSGITHMADNSTTGKVSVSGKKGGQFRINLKGKKAEFLGSTTGVVDIDSGAIFLVFLSSSTTVSLVERNRIQYFD